VPGSPKHTAVSHRPHQIKVLVKRGVEHLGVGADAVRFSVVFNSSAIVRPKGVVIGFILYSKKTC
jgi:hypothetical protein